MRDIKFRGRKIRSNVWVYGYFTYVGIDPCITVKYGTVTNTYQVDLETVGQYIGIEDTDEVMIFEDDTMNLGENKYECVIEWDNERAEFRARITATESVGLHSSFWSKGKITGNIHEATK